MPAYGSARTKLLADQALKACYHYIALSTVSSLITQKVINMRLINTVKCFKKFGQKPKQIVGFPVPGFGLAQMTTFCILEGRGNKQHRFCNSEVEKSIFCTVCAYSIEPDLWD